MTERPEDEIFTYAPFHKFRKLRLYFAYPFVVILAVFARSTDIGFLIGIPIILAGESIRIWSHGYLRKARQLATDGPYAYVRNPLYVGNFLIGLGFCVIIWNPFVIALYVLGFFGLYWVTVRGEEQRLSFKFPHEYQDYLKTVPRFFPRLTPYSKRSQLKFEFHRVIGHGEPITIFGVIILLVLIYLRQEIFQQGVPLGSPHLWLYYGALIVSAFIMGTLFYLRSTKKKL